MDHKEYRRLGKPQLSATRFGTGRHADGSLMGKPPLQRRVLGYDTIWEEWFTCVLYDEDGPLIPDPPIHDHYKIHDYQDDISLTWWVDFQELVIVPTEAYEDF